MTAVRAEVVDRLVTLLSDDTLTTDERIARCFGDDDATPAERYAAAQALASASVGNLIEAGVLQGGTPAAVLDATMRQLQALAAVWGVVSRWDGSLRAERKLGDLLKVLPAEDVADVERFLRWGGFP